MSTYSTAVETSEGLVNVLTKSRWLAVVPMPHTSVMPQGPGDLKGLGSFIKWSTADSAMLSTLHEAIVKLVKEFGASGLVEVGNSIKTTAHLAGAIGADWHDVVKQATQDGIVFPIEDNVLAYVKNFL